MASDYIKIAGGTVYDPANGIDGQVRDIWIAGGKIVEPPTDPEIRAGPRDRRPRAGRHARRRRHALPYRRARRSTPRAKCAPSKSAGASRSTARASRTAARWGACPARLPPATSTPAWATPRPSTRPSPPFGAARPRGIRRHAVHRQGLLRPDGQQSLPDAVDPAGRAGEGQGARRLAAWARRRHTPPSSSIPAASRSGRTSRRATSTTSTRPSTTSA